MAPAVANPLLSDLVARSTKVPPSHVRAVGDRPDPANVDHESGAGVPLIDLKQLDGPGRRRVVEAIGAACETDGFFMVTNHGIPEEVVEGMLSVAREVFQLSQSERLSDDYPKMTKAIRLSTSFSVRTEEKVSEWCDSHRLHCYPVVERLAFDQRRPSNPPAFRQVRGTYSTEARALALILLEAISDRLGLERGHVVNAIGRHVDVVVSYCPPPWPVPEPTHGLPGNKDPIVITLLLHDGLQVQRDGLRVPNALVINISDQLQELRNESVTNRNSGSERISVTTTFSCPTPEVDAPVPVVNDSHLLAYYGRLLLLAIVAVSVVMLMIALFTKHASTVVAAMASASGATLQIAPVFDLVTAVKSKEVNNMNPMKAIFSLFAGYASIAYAFMSLPLNFYVLVPIFVGIAAALLQIAVYLVLSIRNDAVDYGVDETPDLFTSPV